MHGREDLADQPVHLGHQSPVGCARPQDFLGRDLCDARVLPPPLKVRVELAWKRLWLFWHRDLAPVEVIGLPARHIGWVGQHETRGQAKGSPELA